MLLIINKGIELEREKKRKITDRLKEEDKLPVNL